MRLRWFTCLFFAGSIGVFGSLAFAQGAFLNGGVPRPSGPAAGGGNHAGLGAGRGNGGTNFNGQGRRPGVARPYAGGVTYIPYAIPATGYSSFYSPEPGQYDPIFGTYNPGYNPSSDSNSGPTPTVIINQNFQMDTVHPRVMDYSNVPLLPPGPAPENPGAAPTSANGIDGDNPLILIAMKDHTIYPALAYWVEGDTINYVMAGNKINHASISAVDRELTQKLNAERSVEFHLPEPK